MDDFIEEEEEDLYSDLPNFKYDETVDKLQASNKDLQACVLSLEDVIEKQTKELDEIRSQCETLTKNISSLLKTAQNEIKRKDNKINELNKTVLELKTEILTLKKRKHDVLKPIHNEEPILKQQKLDKNSSVKSTVSQFFCNHEVIEKYAKEEKKYDQIKIDIPEKQYVPDIKYHTLYSKRMYNKIYNIGNLDSNIKFQNVETKNRDDVLIERDVEVNMNSKLRDKNILPSKPKSPKESIDDEQENQNILNLKEKNIIVESHKKNYNTCVMNSKPLFEVFKSESLNNEKRCLEPLSDSKDSKQIVLVSGSKLIELNKEVSTLYSETSPRREKSEYLDDEMAKNNGSNLENNLAMISRTNRSANFSKTEVFSQDVCIKHHPQNTEMSSIVNNDKKFNRENDTILEKTVGPNKIQGQCNEKLITSSKEGLNNQFTKSFCLKKSKKSIKSVICPISGEWAKNTEALPFIKARKTDVSKSSPNGETGKEDLDIMEALFGSPLKWTDNSIDDKQVEKLSPPATAFEDSCSAHIENLKFKATKSNVSEISETKITELSLTKKFSYTERKCYFQPSVTEVENESPQFNIRNQSDDFLSKDVRKQPNSTHWPFKRTNNDIPSKNRSVTSPSFSTFVNTESTSEACDVPSSLKNNPNTLDVINLSTKFLKSPKYNDSVLGQFDDTTQLINALAKDPSKLSPIHTPIKETKSDHTSSKTLPQSLECSVLKPSQSISVGKGELVPSKMEKGELAHMETTFSDDNNRLMSVPKASLTISKSKSSIVDKKLSVTKPLISKVEKKLSIPASVISSVEKKLSFPFSVLSPADKKVEKKTILLEQPINILCPRKTPRQIGSCKNNTQSKKQSMKKDVCKNTQDEVNVVKSPSPFIEKQPKTEIRSTQEIVALNKIKKMEDGENVLKSHTVANTISSKFEGNGNSKSPTNIITQNKRINGTNVISSLVLEEKDKFLAVKTSLKRDNSPLTDKIKHSCSRKENVPRRSGQKKASAREDSPLKFKRDYRQVRRESKQDFFKHPLSRRESFKKPNCYFRQSSVERKIAKDWRHSAKTRNYPIKTGNVIESTKMTKNTFNMKSIESKDKYSFCHPSKTPLISRSSRISWSSTTGVVSAKPSKMHPNNDFMTNPPSKMKWILRPIDFDESHNALKDSNLKSISEVNINTLISNSKTESETPISKFLQTTDSSLISLERSSPGKSIVIVAERRPIKFGSNN